MALIPTQRPAVTGTGIIMAAAAAGDTIQSGLTLRVTNAAGAARTVTVVATRACNHGVLHNGGGSVPDGTTREFYIDPERHGSAAGVTYDNVAGLTVAAVAN